MKSIIKPKIKNILLAFFIIASIILSCVLIADAISTNGVIEFYQYGDSYYLIKQLNSYDFYYQICVGNSIIKAGTTRNRNPVIKMVGHGIYQLKLSYGSNSWTVQYFDVYNNLASEEYELATIYAAYCNYGYPDSSTRLVAHFEYNDTEDRPVLIVKNMFDNDFKVTIERNFAAPTTCANYLFFLNENEIYLDYNKEAGSGRFGSVRESETITIR